MVCFWPHTPITARDFKSQKREPPIQPIRGRNGVRKIAVFNGDLLQNRHPIRLNPKMIEKVAAEFLGPREKT